VLVAVAVSDLGAAGVLILLPIALDLPPASMLPKLARTSATTITNITNVLIFIY